MKDRCIWFCGRRDRQIKRMGKRINLDWIEHQITEKLLESACSVVLEKTVKTHSRLHLFIVETSSYNDSKLSCLKRDVMNLLPVEARPDCIHVVSRLPMTAHGKIDRISLLAGVQKTPMFEDMKSTREFLKCVWNEVLEMNESGNAERIFTSSGSEIVKREPGNFHETTKTDVKEDDMFIASGGSSLQAIRLADLIESFVSKKKKTAVDLSELLDIILSKPFDALCEFVDSKLTGTDKQDDLKSKETLNSSGHSLDATADPRGISACENRVNKDTTDAVGVQHGAEFPSKMNTRERKLVEQAPVLPMKRKSFSLGDGTSLKDKKTARTVIKDQGSEEFNDSKEEGMFGFPELKSCFCSIRRRNQWTICEFCKYSTLDKSHMTDQTSVQSSCTSCEAMKSSSQENIPHQTFASLKDDKSPGTHVAYQEMTNVDNTEEEFKVSITCQWRTCLYKCIDASPLVVYAQGRSEGEVFIGSHGHVFMCIRLSDGKVLWESRVGDRIESSAVLSKCGRYVIVGEMFLQYWSEKSGVHENIVHDSFCFSRLFKFRHNLPSS